MEHVNHSQPKNPHLKLHLICYVFLAGIFVSVIAASYINPLVFREPIDVIPAQGQPLNQQIEQRIDPNNAPWAELARLPRIGEVLAKRIVTYREEHRKALEVSENHPMIVFRQIQDLDPIKGIGPKTLTLIEPYLKFPAASGLK